MILDVGQKLRAKAPEATKVVQKCTDRTVGRTKTRQTLE